MFNTYGEIPQEVLTLNDSLYELDRLSGSEKETTAHFLRKLGGYKGSDDIVLERYRRTLIQQVS